MMKELNSKITFLDIDDVKKVMPGLIEVSLLWQWSKGFCKNEKASSTESSS